jgi:hypothetical protein
MKKELLPCIFLIAFWVYLFRDIVIGGHLLFGNDFNAFYLGMKQFLFNEIHENHSIPYWNPYILGGMPFWAHFESTIFYPLGFLFWILPPAKAYGFTMFFHLVLAALFMYALARTWGIGPAGSFVAGAVFSCNGFIMALLYLGHMSPVESYPWLPLIILLLYRALNAESPYAPAVAAGVFWGIQILAGAPQDAFYTYLAALFLGILYMVRSFGHGKRIVQPAICLIILFVVGAGFSAIQVIPGLELIQESVRSALDSYQEVTSRSMPPEGIITAAMPHFFWNPADNFTWLENMPFSMPQENLYVGILPLFLVAFLPLLRFQDKSLSVYTLGLAVAGLLLAMGYHTPLYKIAYYFPGFDRFRSPTRIIVLWVFAIALLAGKGMDMLPAYKASRTRMAAFLGILTGLAIADILIHLDRSMLLKLLSPFVLREMIPNRMLEAERMIEGEFHRFALLGGAACLLSLFMLKKYSFSQFLLRIGPAALSGLLLLDLTMVNSGSIHTDDRFHADVMTARRDLEGTIGKDKDLYRVGSFVNSRGPNFEMGLGYQTVGGFTALIPQRFYEYINHYSEGALPEGWQYYFYGRQQHKVFMDLLNVKYEINRDSRQVLPRASCLPRAFIVPEGVIRPKEEVLQFMSCPDFDPAKIVVLESEPRSTRLTNGESVKRPQAEVLTFRPDDIRIRVESPSPAYLFVSENYYPGWKAYLDESPVNILRGNYLFRVIAIPEGSHLIKMVFQPWSIWIGTVITILSLSSLAVLAVPCLVRKRRRSRWGSSLGINL